MSATVLATLGARLRWAREYAGLSLAQVRVAPVYADLGRWEAGEARPSDEIVERLSKLYAIDLHYLVHGRERSDDPATVQALARSRVSESDRAEVLTYLRRVRVNRG